MVVFEGAAVRRKEMNHSLPSCIDRRGVQFSKGPTLNHIYMLPRCEEISARVHLVSAHFTQAAGRKLVLGSAAVGIWVSGSRAQK